MIFIARLYGEPRKDVGRVRCTAFSNDKGNEPITVHDPTIDPTYAEIHNTYFFTSIEDRPHSLEDMVTAGFYVWDSRK